MEKEAIWNEQFGMNFIVPKERSLLEPDLERLAKINLKAALAK